MVELDNNSLKCISIFEGITGAAVADCMMVEGSFSFVVPQGQMGRAIGKKGSSINRVRTAFKKPVYIFEDSDTMEGFIKNLFVNIPIKNINIHEKISDKVAYVTVSESDRGQAIGKSGLRVKVCRAMLKRRFGCDLKINSKK